ncbi:MAG: HEAT repeat domain-containing protein, partial [Candidatus Acidiferrum sp.]
FATYLEALYTQHHEGNDAFRFEIYNDQMMEQKEGREDYTRAIVDRHYGDPMNMFDATTHEKGAAVLDMLRYVVDGAQQDTQEASQKEALFRALKHYLVAHHAQAADTADLIAAIRESTGLELGWFFREWVYMAGYPKYRVEADYDAANKLEKVAVAQTQHVDATTPIFHMPIEVAFYGANGEQKEVQVRDNSQQQEFDVPLDFEPQWVDFDPDDFIDKTVQFEKPLDALIAEGEKDPSMMSRLWAVQHLGKEKGENAEGGVTALTHVLGTDEFYGVRAAAATSLGSVGTDQAKAALLSALQQSDSRVRTAVVEALASFSKDRVVYDALVNALHNDSSYAVEAAAAQGIGKSGRAEAFEVLQAEATAKPEVHVMQATLAGLAATKDARAVAILLAQAQPRMPERIRASALTGLAEMKDSVEREHAQELVEAVRAALDDSFLRVRLAGEKLVGVFNLTQFQSDLQTDAQSAPLILQREFAQKVLKQLHR